MYRQRQKGLALIDLILGGFMGMMLLAGIASVSTEFSEGRKAQAQGRRLADGTAGLQNYLTKRGQSLIATGTAVGFANGFAPTLAELKAQGFLPGYVSPNMPFGGTLVFTVRRGTNDNLFGLACGSESITQRGQAAPALAGQVMNAAAGAGLRTSIAAPNTLNGPGFQNVLSPVAGPSVVCAWAFQAPQTI